MNGFLRATMRGATGCLPSEWKRRVKRSLLHVCDTEAALADMEGRGFDPKVVIDVGAYVGDWTRACHRFFPRARTLMVEPQVQHLPELQRVSVEVPGAEVACALLGATQRLSVPFRVLESASSVLSEADQANAVMINLPMTTLDALTAGTAFANPDLVKLDVQGYELEVLKGAERVLLSAEAVLMELNLLPILSGAPLFHEAIEFMARRGFHVYEFGTFYRRPYDGALWQTDVFFVRSTSPLVSYQRWS